MADAFNEALGRKLSTASYPVIHVDSKPKLHATGKKTVNRQRRQRTYLVSAIALVLILLVGAVVVATTLTRSPALTPTPHASTAVVLEGETAPAENAIPSP